ncbi:MAG: hypothetical protein HYR64_07850 [Fimbriimonas ginsengisoli]|uniref:M61 family metallopeptidase n=1 Tax=Fimbriimonas ginsengisoli TaxID=1005039 RepID=A0A931PU31_FIMGI|nr:hypothetical protein [Fimbriimonas ginsengisoli]
MLRRARSVAAFLCLLGIRLASADVIYRVTPKFDSKTIGIEMSFARTEFDTDLQIPNWAPGAYILQNLSGGIKNLKITDEHGLTIKPTQPNGFTWRIANASSERFTATYEVSVETGGGTMHYGGPGAYLYLVGRKDERCWLDLETPHDWRIAVGLDEAKPPRGQHSNDGVTTAHWYAAKTYDVLADNPVTVGDFYEDHYTVAGRDHTIALRGEAKSDVDRARLIKACSFISQMQGDFFGVTPYSKYVWHFNVGDRADRAGGLEHLSSTQIGLSSGVGPGTVGVLSHEFFHLWNVKRIRSKPLGPFDYMQLPTTGALWWLEGVTDYYSHSLLHRYGWWDDGHLYKDILSNLDGVRKNAGRLEISPYDSSFRVREAENGKGNSQGLKVSYYDTGWLLGMILDIEIRSQTGGKQSLDDVEHALWAECRNDRPGFEEDEIKKLCIRFGGPALGPLFDQWVMKPGELPVEEELAKVGLRIVERDEAKVDLGFTWQAGRSVGGARVTKVNEGSPLKVGDVVVQIGDAGLSSKPAGVIQKLMDAAAKRAKDGVAISLKVLRPKDGSPGAAKDSLDVDVTPKATNVKRKAVEPLPDATAAQIALREGWFWGKRGKPAAIEDPGA